MADKETMAGGKPRLLYVVNNAAFFLSHRLPLARAALKAGWDVHVATPEGPAVAAVRKQGFAFHPIRLRRGGMSVINGIAAVGALYHLYRRLHPDVVHHDTIKPVLFGGLAARLARVPAVVATISGLGYVFLARGLKAGLLKMVVREAYRVVLAHRNLFVIFENPDDRAEFLARGLVPARKTTVVRGAGVDLGKFVPAVEPEGRPVVVLPARMLWDKGVGEFVDAARMLLANGARARFILCGAPDPANPSAVAPEILERWQRDGVVEWMGHRSDMPEVYRQSHVVCLPSYREGMPKSLLEAAASGRPIVTTSAPGCREAVCDGRNGFLVPPRDAVALAGALSALIGDPALRARMGAESRRLAEAEFSVEGVVRETLRVYSELSAATVSSSMRSMPNRSTTRARTEAELAGASSER